jgi:predicted transposase YbfD/YdcC
MASRSRRQFTAAIRGYRTSQQRYQPSVRRAASFTVLSRLRIEGKAARWKHFAGLFRIWDFRVGSLRWTPPTQKKTFNLIISLGCHFLSQVKKNCPKLWYEAALHASTTAPVSVHEYHDLGHGRQVQRRVEVYDGWEAPPMGWNGIKRIVKVRRWGKREGRQFDEIAYYVLSKPIDCAEMVAKAIQSHWSIENRLHWSKDVNIREDYTTIRNMDKHRYSSS